MLQSGRGDTVTRRGGEIVSASPHLRVCASGFSLIELVITVSVLAILTLGVIPLVQVSVKRQKEQQLHEALRQMREAIDQFHREAIAGAQMQANQQQGLGGTPTTGRPATGTGGTGTGQATG